VQFAQAKFALFRHKRDWCLFCWRRRQNKFTALPNNFGKLQIQGQLRFAPTSKPIPAEPDPFAIATYRRGRWRPP
jgi:hypothetical protein